jgi:signal transduction histidine kinase
MKKFVAFVFLSGFSCSFLLAQSAKMDVSAMHLDADSFLRIVNNPPDDTNKVNAYHMLGAMTAGMDANKAIEYSKKGIKLGQLLHYPKGAAVNMLNVSYCYGLLNDFPRAVKYIDSAIGWYKTTGKTDRIAYCYRTRAEHLQKLGKLRQALNDCDTAMFYAEKSTNKSAKTDINKIIAAVYYQQNDFTQSRIFYEKAYAGYASFKDSITMANILNKLGNIYQHLDQYDLGISNYEKAINLALATSQENNLSEFYRNLAGAWLKKGDKKKAELYASRSVGYAKLKKNKLQLAEAQTMLSTIYLDKDSTSAAIQSATESYALAGDIASKEARLTSAEALAKGYYRAGNYKQAYDYLQVSKTINDSVVAEKYNQDVTTLQTSFKVNEKDKEILLLNKDKALQLQEIKQQRLLIAGAAAIVILALTGIWLFLGRNKLRQQMKELELRNRIAADLHDEVGSSLSSIHMLSQMATQNGNEKTHKDILQRMSSNAKETMDKMGDIVWMIKPGETEAGSLKQRMERFAYEICGSKNIEVMMRLEELEKVKLSMDQRKNIYLIFKEAINNAVKYSGTQKIEVHTFLKEKNLILQVKDFGKGFDSSIVKKGNGLDNMRQRAKDLHATLDVETAPSKGTWLKMTMPV